MNEFLLKSTMQNFSTSQEVEDAFVSIGHYCYDRYNYIHHGKESQIHYGLSPFVKGDLAVKLTKFKGVSDVAFKKAKNESNNLQNLQHKNIIKYVDCIAIDESTYALITKVCNQGTLKSYVLGGGFKNINDILHCFCGILKSVKFLFKRKILHMNINSENILIHNQNPKLLDFSIANNMDLYEKTQYSSPQALNGEKYDIKDEIWSLGLILYFMVNGNLPWCKRLTVEELKTRFDITVECKEKILNFTDKSTIDVSSDLKELILQMLELEKKDRIEWNDLWNNHLIKNAIKQFKIISKARKELSKKIKSEQVHNNGVGSTQSLWFFSCIVESNCSERNETSSVRAMKIKSMQDLNK